MKIALLGGSFDPPHLAHQFACLYCLEAEGCERVWLIPCFRHAFAKNLTRFEQRIQMCSLLAKGFGGRVIVSEAEKLLYQGQVNRTIDTVSYLQAHHPLEQFSWIIGSDILREVKQWKDFEILQKKIPILVLQRAGNESQETGWNYSSVIMPKVSSTDVRNRVNQNLSIHGLVPVSVENYIQEHRLYSGS